MKKKLVSIYTEKIVSACKIMCMNAHVINVAQARHIFMAFLVSNIHYGVDTIEILDEILEIDLITTCDAGMLLNYGFSVSEALIEYSDSIMSSYIKVSGKKSFKFDVENYL